MKTTCALLCVGFLFHATPLVADVDVPDDLRFVFRDEHFMTPDEKVAWYRQLHDTPKITDRLCDLLWACYSDSGRGLGEVMGALMHRDDIAPLQLKRITDEMRRLATVGMSEARNLGVENLLYGVRILERYPTPEHEDLALLLLTSDDSILRTNAATTLGRIGTARSVEPIRKFFDPFRHIKTDPPNDGHQVFEAEQMLLARVAAKTAQSSSHQGTTAAQKSTVPESAKPMAAGNEQSDSTPWIVWTVIIAAAIGLLWLLLKRRS